MKNVDTIIIYVKEVNYYFHNFRMPVKSATMKIESAIENGQSLKLRQT
jgi:hypothetical protein